MKPDYYRALVLPAEELPLGDPAVPEPLLAERCLGVVAPADVRVGDVLDAVVELRAVDRHGVLVVPPVPDGDAAVTDRRPRPQRHAAHDDHRDQEDQGQATPARAPGRAPGRGHSPPPPR